MATEEINLGKCLITECCGHVYPIRAKIENPNVSQLKTIWDKARELEGEE